MKTRLILAISLFAGIQVSAQSFKFTPKWKIGEQKTYQLTESEVKFVNGEETESTLLNSDLKVKVVSETPTEYKLEITHLQYDLAAALREAEMEEMAKEEESKSYVYMIDKATGKATFQKPAQKKKAKSDNPLATLMEGGEERAAEKYCSFLWQSYGNEYLKDDTLKITEKGENPFSPGEEMNSTTNYWITNPGVTSCEINSRIDYDLTAFKQLMVEMVTKMAESFGADEKAMKKMKAEMRPEDFDMTMDNLSTITYNYQTTWPTKAEMSAKVDQKDPKKSRLTKTHQTAVLKP